MERCVRQRAAGEPFAARPHGAGRNGPPRVAKDLGGLGSLILLDRPFNVGRGLLEVLLRHRRDEFYVGV